MTSNRRYSSPTFDDLDRFDVGPGSSFASSPTSTSDDEGEISSPALFGEERTNVAATTTATFDLEKIWALPCWSSPESAHRRRRLSIASFSTIDSDAASSLYVVDDIITAYHRQGSLSASSTTDGPGLSTPTSGVASSEGAFRFGSIPDSDADNETARTSWPSSRAESLKAVVVEAQPEQEKGYPTSALFRPRSDLLVDLQQPTTFAERKSSLPAASAQEATTTFRRRSVLWQAELPTAAAAASSQWTSTFMHSSRGSSVVHLPLSSSSTQHQQASSPPHPRKSTLGRTPAVARPGSWFDREFLGFAAAGFKGPTSQAQAHHDHDHIHDVDIDVADLDPIEAAPGRGAFYGLANKSRTFLASLSQPNLVKKAAAQQQTRGGLTISHPVGPTYTTSTVARSAVPIAPTSTLAAPIEFVKPKSGPGAAFKRKLARFAGKNNSNNKKAISNAAQDTEMSLAVGEAPARPARSRTRPPPTNAVASSSSTSSSPPTSQPSTPARKVSPPSSYRSGQQPPPLEASSSSYATGGGGGDSSSMTTSDPISQPMTPTTSQRSADVDLAARLAALGSSSPSAAMSVLANAQARASSSGSNAASSSAAGGAIGGTYVNARLARERSRERELAERQKRLPVVKDGYKIVDGVEKKVSSSGVYTPPTFPGVAGTTQKSPSLQQQGQMSSPGSPSSPFLPTPASEHSYFAIQQRALLRRTSSSATGTAPIATAAAASERRKSFIKLKQASPVELAYSSIPSPNAMHYNHQARSLSASAAFDAFPRAAEGHGLGVGMIDTGDDELPPPPGSRKARSPSMPLSHLHGASPTEEQRAPSTSSKTIKRKPVPAAKVSDAA